MARCMRVWSRREGGGVRVVKEVRRWKRVDGVVGIVRSAACALTTRKHTSRNRCVRVSRVLEAREKK